jgi:hypothetical protein
MGVESRFAWGQLLQRVLELTQRCLGKRGKEIVGLTCIL